MIDTPTNKTTAPAAQNNPYTPAFTPAQLELKPLPALKTAFNQWYISSHSGYAHYPWKNAFLCSKYTQLVYARHSGMF